MDAGLSSRSNKLQQGLEALLVEVNGLANRLKSNNPREAMPSATRTVLHVLQRCGSQTVPQLARARFSSRQNIQILVNRLQKEGLVEFVENPDHKRSVLVRLTQRGQVAISEATQEEAELNIKLLPSFSPSELSSATEVLNKLRKMLDGKGSPKRTANQMSQKTIQERLETSGTPLPEPAKKADETSKLAEADVADGELPVNLL
jgi:DNA-binding MarR family transcriptional regulator